MNPAAEATAPVRRHSRMQVPAMAAGKTDQSQNGGVTHAFRPGKRSVDQKAQKSQAESPFPEMEESGGDGGAGVFRQGRMTWRSPI